MKCWSWREKHVKAAANLFLWAELPQKLSVKHLKQRTNETHFIQGDYKKEKLNIYSQLKYYYYY